MPCFASFRLDLLLMMFQHTPFVFLLICHGALYEAVMMDIHVHVHTYMTELDTSTIS